MDAHDEKLHQGSGPIKASYPNHNEPLHRAFMDTFEKLERDLRSNYRGGLGTVASSASVDGKRNRSFAGTAYLPKEVRERENLKLVTGAVVQKILLERVGGEVVAAGARVQVDGMEVDVIASEEVLLVVGLCRVRRFWSCLGLEVRRY